MTPNKSSFVIMYSDDSGIEYGVHYNTYPTHQVKIESQGQEIEIDADRLEWFIDALQQASYYYDAHTMAESKSHPDNGGQ